MVHGGAANRLRLAVHLRTPNFASEPLHKDKIRFDLCHQSLTGDLPGP